MKKTSIAETVRTLLQPVADELGYFLWDVEYVKEGADWYLRATIDTENGVTIDDCERFHRAIDPILDEADPIENAYTLEVSSPGIERELKTEEHIDACTGWDVEIRLFAPIEGVKVFRGVLAGLDAEGHVLLDVGEDQDLLTFERSAIAKLCTVYDFEN